MALSLTFDHRIIDGVLGAQFLKFLKHRIEDTRLMLSPGQVATAKEFIVCVHPVK